MTLLKRKEIDYTRDDFTVVCNLSSVPMFAVVRHDSPYRTMKEFIEAAKTKKLKYSTFGALSIAHIKNRISEQGCRDSAHSCPLH
jgi:tripartite-type tricarboxylate transporter receptor subunit TctC